MLPSFLLSPEGLEAALIIGIVLWRFTKSAAPDLARLVDGNPRCSRR